MDRRGDGGNGFGFLARVSSHLRRVANSKVRGIGNIEIVEVHLEDRRFGVVKFLVRASFHSSFLDVFSVSLFQKRALRFVCAYRKVVRCCLVDLV